MISQIKYNPCRVVAEGCANHGGDLNTAKLMTLAAYNCGAHFVKWQKRNPKESVPKEWHDRPHPNPANAFGDTYLQHREALEFSVEQHKELCDFAHEQGIGYGVSVWDMTSAEQMVKLDCDFIKIPSACNLNFKLFDFLIHNYMKDIHISLGMTSKEQRNTIVDYVGKYPHRVIVYHTTTEYPCPFDRLYLREVSELVNNTRVPRIGFSGHHRGIAADVAAYAFGAEWIERHFVLDRTMKGTDASASLEPQGLSKLVRDLNATYEALRYKPDNMTDMEKEQSKKLRVAT